ncbi:BON domain-containing protein [Scytonema hofmannii FACHB-248]|uniref:BON domain-containing protein n=1 Tax=Scytonema hofmannii FACHB-248 TaxID=1842502 RepID=A0ABR8GNG6_9CYAN|nr:MULTISPECIES: BON domain-containing protein [Nostocales]MBD2604703.1 BON domain-containing protein [Scytonema hofmannii FACHB-248]
MGWLQRLFGMEKPADAQVNPETAATDDSGQDIPLERVGLNGEYDQSGLAKRVALAFDESGLFDEIDSLYVAQTGSTVVLKGQVPSQEILDEMVAIATGVSGATDVNTDQVTVG